MAMLTTNPGLRGFDYIWIALVAAALTWVVSFIARIASMAGRPARLPFRAGDLSKVIARCCALFPDESILFKGRTFTRGMAVRVTVAGNRSFEGKLIGGNKDNIICVLTKTFVAADILDNIVDMIELDVTGELG